MPKYFVCEMGAMGQIHIVYVTDVKSIAEAWIRQEADRDLYLYEQVSKP